MLKDLQIRKSELSEAGKRLGLSDDGRRRLQEQEESDYHLAMALYQISFQRLTLPNEPQGRTVSAFLRLPCFRLLAVEQTFTFTLTLGSRRIACALQPDALLYRDSDQTLWCIDYKTCAETPTIRLQTCSTEQQTLHYLHGLSVLLPDLRSLFSLPETTKVGGMTHIAFRKPTIRLSGEDRAYTVNTRTLKTGPNKGQIRTEKVYEGEPLFSNYIRRCEEWLTGTGSYLHLADERKLNPSLNLSTVFYDRVDRCLWDRYHARMSHVASFVTRDPWPSNFPDNPASLRGLGGKLSPYLPFYTEPPSKWPQIIARDFLIRHRDADLLELDND